MANYDEKKITISVQIQLPQQHISMHYHAICRGRILISNVRYQMCGFFRHEALLQAMQCCPSLTIKGSSLSEAFYLRGRPRRKKTSKKTCFANQTSLMNYDFCQLHNDGLRFYIGKPSNKVSLAHRAIN